MDNIKREIVLCESQLSSFKTRGTKTSATRARSHLLNIKKQCDKLRREILEQSKSLKNEKNQEKNKEKKQESEVQEKNQESEVQELEPIQEEEQQPQPSVVAKTTAKKPRRTRAKKPKKV